MAGIVPRSAREQGPLTRGRSSRKSKTSKLSPKGTVVVSREWVRPRCVTHLRPILFDVSLVVLLAIRCGSDPSMSLPVACPATLVGLHKVYRQSISRLVRCSSFSSAASQRSSTSSSQQQPTQRAPAQQASISWPTISMAIHPRRRRRAFDGSAPVVVGRCTLFQRWQRLDTAAMPGTQGDPAQQSSQASYKPGPPAAQQSHC